MQDPRQWASKFKTLVDVEDQVSFIIQPVLSLVVTVPEEQLIHLKTTDFIFYIILILFQARLHIKLNMKPTHLRLITFWFNPLLY